MKPSLKNSTVIAITGIDTDTGKTIATGLLARYLVKKGIQIITQKMVQTGCKTVSEDVQVHRKIMGMEWTNHDQDGSTCPYLFQYPASPHLAAAMEEKSIDCSRILTATETLKTTYDCILLEGAGGLQVPLNKSCTVLDYIQDQHYPVILVSSSKLGSINHTLLSMEALKARSLDLIGLIYNTFPGDDALIAADSIHQMDIYMQRFGFEPKIKKMDAVNLENPPDMDFHPFFDPFF